MTPEALCPSCCNRASEMCADSCAEGPVVECSRHGVTKPSPVLARACSLCLGAPAPGETCRACGGQGEPFLASEVEGGWSQPRDEFKVGCDCGELRAEVERLTRALRSLVRLAKVPAIYVNGEDRLGFELALKSAEAVLFPPGSLP